MNARLLSLTLMFAAALILGGCHGKSKPVKIKQTEPAPCHATSQPAAGTTKQQEVQQVVVVKSKSATSKPAARRGAKAAIARRAKATTAAASRPVRQATSRPTSAPAITAGDLVPAAPAGWSKGETILAGTRPQVEDLIDGEAGQYYEYDLVSLTRAVYSRGEDKITLDVYQMPSPREAFGAYSGWRQNADEMTAVGVEAAWVQGTLNFNNGRFFVRIKPSSNEGDLPAVTADLGKQVVAKRKFPPARIPYLAALPKAEQVQNSVNYVKRNYRGQEFFTSVVSAKYKPSGAGNEYELFVAAYRDDAAAAKALAAAAKAFPQAKQLSTPRRGIFWQDEFDGQITVQQQGRFLIGATCGQESKLEAVAAGLQQRKKQ